MDGPDSEETLRRLEDRIEQATEAVERLLGGTAADAGARIRDGVRPPSSGWRFASGGSHATPGRDELEPFVALLRSAQDLVPAELQQRVLEAVRQLLLAVRALIDWYLERLERPREAPVEVEDIPVL